MQSVASEEVQSVHEDDFVLQIEDETPEDKVEREQHESEQMDIKMAKYLIQYPGRAKLEYCPGNLKV